MAIFSKSNDKTPAARSGGARLTPAESAISIIGPGMAIKGDVSTDGTVRIEGNIRGTVRAGKAVVLGKEAEVIGDIYTQDAVIGGRVTGTVVAESRLELQKTSTVEGEIRARAEHLQLDEGARFSGQIQMIEPGEASATLPGREEPRTEESRAEGTRTEEVRTREAPNEQPRDEEAAEASEDEEDEGESDEGGKRSHGRRRGK